MTMNGAKRRERKKKIMKNTKNIMWVVALIAVVVLIGVVAYGYFRKATFKAQNPIVTMEVENFGTIKMELYPDKAPESVSNFIALANRGFYNGTKFHRVVKDFMIQTGSKNGDGTTGATLGELKGTEDKKWKIITEVIVRYLEIYDIDNGTNHLEIFKEVYLTPKQYTYKEISERNYISKNTLKRYITRYDSLAVKVLGKLNNDEGL